MSPKVQLFLFASGVFLISFVLSFSLFGGAYKLQRMYQAQVIEQKNKVYEQKKQETADKLKQEQINALQETASTTSQENASSLVPPTQTAIQENNTVTPSGVDTTLAVTKTTTSPITVEQLVEKYQNILDLNADPEWKNYPLDLRKKAYEIMNENRVKAETNKPSQDNINAIFLDGTGSK